jgi:hypothetical protein
MDTIRYLLSKIIVLIIVIAAFCFLYWMGSKLVPYFPTSTHITKDSTGVADQGEFFLPSPRNVSTYFKQPVVAVPLTTNNNQPLVSNADGKGQYIPTGNGQYIYVSDTVSYDSHGNVIYTRGTTQALATTNQTNISQNTGGQIFDPNQSGFSIMESYVRNLSIYRGGSVYMGLTFVGDARENMFVNGKFLLFVVDPTGRAIGSGEAETLEQWSVPGWHRFSAKITSTVPYKGAGCGLVFQQPHPSGIHVAIPAQCN